MVAIYYAMFSVGMWSARLHPRRWFGALLVGSTIWLWSVAPAQAQVVSPGKLATAHAELDGSAHCDSCHASGGHVEADRCLDCHEVLRDRIAKRAGFHARLGTSGCGKCHQDHRGRNFDIIRWPSTEAKFPHARAQYRLRNGHREPVCRDCHKPEFQVDPRVRAFADARRKRTWLGLSGIQCESCHLDPHGGELGGACGNCHDHKTFTPANLFKHETSVFVLTGGHSKVECVDCHPEPPADKVRSFRVADFHLCKTCHEDPHNGAMTPARARPLLTCESCHVDRAWNELRYERASHAVRTMPLVGGHAKPTCVDCHGDKATATPRTACGSCHRDVHAGKFGRDCQRCHGVRNWAAHPPAANASPRLVAPQSLEGRIGLAPAELAAVAFHDKTRYRLTGLHVRVACDKCHPRSGGKRSRRRRGYSRYVGLAFARCVDCHSDPHEGQFARDGAESPACTQCHSTAGWSLTGYGVARHDEARMALRGAHRAIACSQCHTAERAPATRYTFAARACSDCHSDAHGKQFGATACDKCHGEQAFVPATFDHTKTSLPLTGSHAKTACSSCHLAARGTKVVQYRGLEPACAACHRDLHYGQFSLPAPARACSDCHGTESFEINRFDHPARAGYALAGGHDGVGCAKCHHRVTLGGGREVTLYRLGTTQCTSCHREQHEGTAATKRRVVLGRAAPPKEVRLVECERCHQVRSWQSLVSSVPLDHGRVGYPLRGGHRGARCSACHTATRTLSRECKACHADRHAGELGSACADCHRPQSWEPSQLLVRHMQTRLPLTGGHALADCTSCHPRAVQQQFSGTPVDCYGCHAADYLPPIAHPDHIAQGYGRECEQCHRPAGWSPAYFSHTTWPLTGAHRGTSCNACHDDAPTPRDCLGCHAEDRDRANSPDHFAPGFSTDCDRCHTTSAWQPAEFPDHEQYFPIASGRHRRFECADCHTDPTDFGRYTCMTGACHRRAETDDEHDEVSGYLYESSACLDCHPRGRE